MTTTAPVQNNQSNKIDDESRYQGGIENQQNSNYIRNNQDEIITDFENDRDSTIAGMSDEDFTLTNEDTAIGDTLSLNGEALGEYYRLINSEDYLRMLLAMINDTIDEATRIISSPYLPPPVHEEGNSGKKPTQVESAVKASKISGQYLGLFISTLFKRIMNHNQLLLEKRMKEIEKETTEWHDYLFGSCKNEAEWAAKQQKYAVRAFNDALKVSYSEMQKMMDKAGFPALDQNFSGKLEGKFDALSSELFEDGKNGYIDENKLRNAVSELRLGFMNLINVQRLMLSAWDMKVRAKDLGFQVATGIKPGASMSDAVSQKFDFEASHLTNMFDIQSNNLITIGKLTNKEIYLQKQVEKANSWWAILTKVFSAFLAIVAIVLAIVALVLVCLGVTAPLGLILATCAVAVLGAVSKWLEVKLGDELIDDDMKFQDTKYEENIQTKKKKEIDKLESVEDDIIGDVNSSLRGKTSDGVTTLNYAGVSELNMRLMGVGNMMRLIFEAQRVKEAAKALIFTANTGLGAIKMSPIATSILEAHLQQKQTEFSFAVANQESIVEAKNLEHEQAKQVERATYVMAISCAVAVACAAIGGGIGYGAGKVAEEALKVGISVGFAIGMAIGGFIGELSFAHSSYGSYGKDYQGNVGAFARFANERTLEISTNRISENKKSEKLLARLENIEKNALAKLASNGIINAGDGYKAVNAGLMGETAKILQAVANVRAIIIAAQETKTQIKALILSTHTGLQGIVDSGVSGSINRSTLEANLQTVRYIQKELSQVVEAKNRAREAEKDVIKAAIKMSITVAVSAVMCGLAVPFGSAIAALSVGTFSLLNGIVDSVVAGMTANSDNGDVALPDKKETEKDKNLKGNYERLDEIMASLSADSTMIEDIGGGFKAVNSAFSSGLETEMKAVTDMAMFLNLVQQTLQEAKAMITEAQGISAVSTPTSSDAVVNNVSQFMLAKMEAEFKMLENYMTRENQKAEAQRQMIASIVGNVVDSIVLAVSIAMTVVKADAKSTAAKPAPKGGTADKATQVKTLEKQAFRLGIAKEAISLFRTVSDAIVGACYDKYMSDNEKDTSKSEKENNAAQERSANTKSKGSSDRYAILDSWEAQSEADGIARGYIEMLKQMDVSIKSRSANEAGSAIGAFFKGAIDSSTSIVGQAREMKVNIVQVEYEVAKADLEASRDRLVGDIMYALPQDMQQKIVMLKQQAEQNPSAANTLAYADYIENQVLPHIEANYSALSDRLSDIKEKTIKLNEQRKKVMELLDPDSAPEFIQPEEAQTGEDDIEVVVRDRAQSTREKREQLIDLRKKYDQAQTPEEKEIILAEMAEVANGNYVAEALGTGADIYESALFDDVQEALLSKAESEVITSQMSKTMKKAVEDLNLSIVNADSIDIDKLDNPEDIQNLYESAHERVFVKARERREAASHLQRMMVKRLKGESLSPEEIERGLRAVQTLREASPNDAMLQVSLGRTEAILTSTGPLVEPAHAENARGQFSQEEGKARAEITQFNRFCGRLDRQMRLVTKERDGVERGLTPVNPNVIAPQQGGAQTVVAPAQASLGEVSFENEGTELASLLPNREETGNVDNTSESFDIMMQGLEAYFGEALAQNEALLSQADNLSGICDDVQNEALVNA